MTPELLRWQRCDVADLQPIFHETCRKPRCGRIFLRVEWLHCFLMDKNHCKRCSEGIILATSNSSPNVTMGSFGGRPAGQNPPVDLCDTPPPIRKNTKPTKSREDWDFLNPTNIYVFLARSTTQTLSTWQIQSCPVVDWSSGTEPNLTPTFPTFPTVLV